MNKIHRRANLIANITIVIVSALLIGVITYRYSSSAASTQTKSVQPTIGEKINLDNIDFSTQSKTVIIALQTGCRFCNESIPFYKKIIEETKGKNIKFIAVFPTKVEESLNHLKEFGATGFEVKQANITTLDTNSTPTLILTDSEGKIEKFWIGKLSASSEADVINRINS